MTIGLRRRSAGRVVASLVACALAVSTLIACAPAPSPRGLPADAAPDYQLGGAYDPPAGVGIVARDRQAEPAAGTYSLCYVNGFQTQPGERDAWPDDVLLRRDGDPFIDPGWPDEVLLDTSTADKREAIIAILRPWIEGCSVSGFDAVEFDNLDTFARSDGALRLQDNLALATALVDLAHAAGLAAGQKNAAEHTRELRDEAGFDFAVAEECAAFDECTAYTDVYGDAVIDIEYTDTLPAPFAELCEVAPPATVLRDRALSLPGDPDYAFELC